MGKIGMNESTGKKAIPLISMSNCRRIKNKVANHFLIIKSSDRNKRCKNNDDERNCKIHGYILKGRNLK